MVTTETETVKFRKVAHKAFANDNASCRNPDSSEFHCPPAFCSFPPCRMKNHTALIKSARPERYEAGFRDMRLPAPTFLKQIFTLSNLRLRHRATVRAAGVICITPPVLPRVFVVWMLGFSLSSP